MAQVRLPLDEQQEAHLALILQIHATDVQQLEMAARAAEQRRVDRIGPLLRTMNIPAGTTFDVVPQQNGAPAFIVYEAPDIPAIASDEAPPQTASGS